MPSTPPHPALTFLWVAWLAIALWCAVNVLLAIRRVKRLDKRAEARSKIDFGFSGPVVVIIAIKGVGEHFKDHVASLLGQDYPAYRLLFAVESEDDPAHAALMRVRSDLVEAHDSSACGGVEIVVAGRADSGGQKAYNLLAALRVLEPTDEAVVFADADINAEPDWIRRLVNPLNREDTAATTGYRWIVPQSPDHANLPTRFASIINASVALLQGPNWRCHAWGGSTAMLQKTLHEIDLPQFWDGALSDDYQVTRAIHHAGRRLVFVPRVLVLSPGRFTWSSLMEFGRRQYLITRVHAKLIWSLGLVATAIYTGGWITVIGAGVCQAPGWQWGVYAWGGVILADLVRAAARSRLARLVFGAETRRELASTFRLEYLATPVWMAVHLAIILASAWGKTITWAGIVYRLNGPRDIEIIKRDA